MWPPWALAAAAMLVALGTGFWAVGLTEERASLRADVQEMGSRLAASDSLLLEADRRLSVVEGAAEIRQLAGTSAQASATARVFIDPATGRAILYAYDLPILPPSSIYQLWAIRAGSPEPLGTFRAGPTGAARLELEDIQALADVGALAVTVEPIPGSPQPTGEMVLSSGQG